VPFPRYKWKGPKSLHFSTPLWFNPPTEGFPWDDIRKIFTEGSQMAKVPNGVETLSKISIAWVGCTNSYRWHTTDGRTTTYSEHERSLKTAARLVSGTIFRDHYHYFTQPHWLLVWRRIVYTSTIMSLHIWTLHMTG